MAKAPSDETATIRCADFDLWMLLLKDVHGFVGCDPINMLATDKLSYVLREMEFARRK